MLYQLFFPFPLVKVLGVSRSAVLEYFVWQRTVFLHNTFISGYTLTGDFLSQITGKNKKCEILVK